MAGLSVGGIASGLDSATLIADLIKLEAIPQSLLIKRAAAAEVKITDFQSLNTKIKTLGTIATTAKNPAALQTFTASSSASGVSVTAGAGAAIGSLDVTVNQLAQPQTSVTAALTTWPDDPPVITIVGADGVSHEVTAASTSLNDVVTAINAGGTGVTATKVASGIDADGNPQFRLQLTSSATGADASFTAYRGSSASVSDGTATNLLTEAGAATTRTAQDAKLTLWAGTDAEQTVTSASNTFADIMPGVSITASKVSTDAVTVNVSRDSAKATAVVKGLVDNISTTLGLIDSKTASTKTTDALGNEVTALGSFTSDATIRDIRQAIVTAASAPVNGRSPSEIGISFDKKGSITFDTAVFEAAQKKDPAFVESVFAAIAERVAAASTNASSTTGSLTTKITGTETTVKGWNADVLRWDLRLEGREETLKRTYSALEVAIGKLNSQQDYLLSQLDALKPSDN
ncbi:MAG: hypothetical protein JWQ43_3856 [Glaciihabitans sp.]|nr:hypothetical protein [Glaciihabitans sp.]